MGLSKKYFKKRVTVPVHASSPSHLSVGFMRKSRIPNIIVFVQKILLIGWLYKQLRLFKCVLLLMANIIYLQSRYLLALKKTILCTNYEESTMRVSVL